MDFLERMVAQSSLNNEKSVPVVLQAPTPPAAAASGDEVARLFELGDSKGASVDSYLAAAYI